MILVRAAAAGVGMGAIVNTSPHEHFAFLPTLDVETMKVLEHLGHFVAILSAGFAGGMGAVDTIELLCGCGMAEVAERPDV